MQRSPWAAWILAASMTVACGAAEPNTLTPEELADGWILLFDGETDFGWRASSDANWQVRDGVISVSKGEKGFFYTTSQFGNYRLKVDFRSAPGTNSGVFLRTSPHDPDVTTQCYELNIADGGTNPFPTGSFVQRKKADGEAANDSDDWQTFDVTADGGHFLVKLDDRVVLEYDDPEPLGRGYIGLQLNTGLVEFRNIKLRPLDTVEIFNGKTLDGWTTFDDSATECTVTPDGAMHLVGGSGQIETQGQYDDFTLQLDVFINGDDVNSGVFFRCIPGESMNGYESQVNNNYLDGDRTKPKDCGTGGIFRRTDARRVVADNREWFHKTLHVDDRHMAVWVNGYQVSDWSDNRKPDANPRRGLRLEPGTIQFQGHDPGTNVKFRNLRLAELPPRR